MGPLYTIGHSNHGIDAFIELLKAQGVSALADVRSVPFSKRHPQFRKDTLAASLKAAGIAYVFLGRELGGKPDDPALMHEGKPDYGQMAKQPAFADGIQRLKDGMARYTISLMCAERDPLQCHRFALICRAVRGDMAITHILVDGKTETQTQAEARLMAEEGIEVLPFLDDDPLVAAFRKRFSS